MGDSLEKRIFIICPVRNVTDKEKRYLEDYILKLEAAGHLVHYPSRDTNQNDKIGLSICMENRQAIQDSDEVHVYWNSSSSGSGFDLGMAFMGEKPLVLINRDSIKRTQHKSFENVLLELDEKYRPETIRLNGVAKCERP
jgi:hypothetical protein